MDPKGSGGENSSRSLTSLGPEQTDVHKLELDALTGVLKAFKAQSDHLTWDKESLITELRRALNVSNDELSQLLRLVRSVDHTKNLRDEGASLTAYAHRSKQVILGSGNAPGAPSPSSMNVQPAFDPPILRPRVPQRNLMDESSKSNQDLRIGWRVMRRLPEDHMFREAVVAGYDPQNGHHCLMYNRHTPDATCEWVDIKTIPLEDIKWLGDDNKKKSQRHQKGESSKRGKSRGRPPKSGGAGPSSSNSNAYTNKKCLGRDPDYIEIYVTSSLINKGEKMLQEPEVDPEEYDWFRHALKEQEKALVYAIERLTEAGSDDGESGQDIEASKGKDIEASKGKDIEASK